MKSKIITVVGKFDVEMTYKPSPDDSILLKLADAVNRFFIPYLPREFDPDTGDIMLFLRFKKTMISIKHYYKYFHRLNLLSVMKLLPI